MDRARNTVMQSQRVNMTLVQNLHIVAVQTDTSLRQILDNSELGLRQVFVVAVNIQTDSTVSHASCQKGDHT